jgi:hypothetical protein
MTMAAVMIALRLVLAKASAASQLIAIDSANSRMNGGFQ